MLAMTSDPAACVDALAITTCDLDDLLSMLEDGEHNSVSALLAQLELENRLKAVLAPTVQRQDAFSRPYNGVEKFIPTDADVVATPQTQPNSIVLADRLELDQCPIGGPAPTSDRTCGSQAFTNPHQTPSGAEAPVSTATVSGQQRVALGTQAGRSCEADHLVLACRVVKEDSPTMLVDGTPSTRRGSSNGLPSDCSNPTLVDTDLYWLEDPDNLSCEIPYERIGRASITKQHVQENQESNEDEVPPNGYVSEGKSSQVSFSSVWSKGSPEIDEPRRWVLWLAAAMITLALQWAPLLHSNECCADWTEDGSSIELTVLHSLADHPKDAFTPLARHIIYPWTAAAFVTLHFDHRGRYRVGCIVQRWTWRYTLILLARAIMVWGLSCVTMLCPRKVLVVVKFVDDISRVLRLLSSFIFSYLAIAKLQMLQLKAAARWCKALLLFSGSLIIVAFIFTIVVAYWNPQHGFIVFNLIVSISCLSWLACYALAAAAMFGAAGAAEAQAIAENMRRQQMALAAAHWTRTTAWATIVYAMCATLMGIVSALPYNKERGDRRDWAAQVLMCSVIVFESVASTICAAVLSGLVGPRAKHHQEQSLSFVGAQVVARAERRVKQKLLQVCSKRGTAAAALQAIIDGREAGAIFDQAKRRFRRISWEILSRLRHLMDGTSLDGQGANSELYNFSEPCGLSECDVFMSHSWHDDFALKWEALEKWCEQFKAKHGRYPTLWVDKICINQCDVAEDLQCLPVFLAGCNSMLILAGPTFTSRLWCVMELYVYVMMQSAVGTGETSIEAIALGRDEEEQQVVKHSFVSGFAAEECTCAYDDDKAKIMAVIGKTAGGVSEFNAKVRQLAQKVMFQERGSIWRMLTF